MRHVFRPELSDAKQQGLHNIGEAAALTGVSAKMSPVGSVMFRCFASRSTNCRATTSSIVLEALFTSIP